MSLLVIVYWILLLLMLISIFVSPAWAWYPRTNSIVTVILFVIIGLKILKPTW